MMEVDTILSLLECPVCLLTPRSPPIYQCKTGHFVCSECQPNLVRCPICDVKYRTCLTRDFFAEKLLEHLERKCQYQHFGCDFRVKDSEQLLAHESCCSFKPCVPEKRRTKHNNHEEIDNDESDNESDDEDEEEEEEIEFEDIFIANFAFILVLLRAYIMEYVDYSEEQLKEPDSLNFEYLMIFLLCTWLYYSWQENELHLLHETSPFIAAWFMTMLMLTIMIKVKYSPWSGETQMQTYLVIISWVKPLVTLLTGLFSCCVHVFVHQLWRDADEREDNKFTLAGVLLFSVTLSTAEVVWSLQAYIDQFFYHLFWVQSFFIVLPFGLAGRNFLDF